MEEKYRILLFRYLFNKIGLNVAEKYLLEKKVDYVDREDLMCEEEKMCLKYSKYFYLLNNLAIDTLTNEEKKILEKVEYDVQLSDEITSFITSTFKKVLFSNSNGNIVFYGPYSKRFQAIDNQIVIGIKFEEYGFVNEKLKDETTILQENCIVDDMIKVLENLNREWNIKIIKYNELFQKMYYGNSLIR